MMSMRGFSVRVAGVVAASVVVGFGLAAQPAEALGVATPADSTGPTIAAGFANVGGSPTGSVPLGSRVELTLEIDAGPTAQTGVSFVETLPAGLTLSASGTKAFCGGTETFTPPSTISLSGAALAANGSCLDASVLVAATAGAKVNPVTVSSDQGTGNTATAYLNVVAPPSLTKSFGDANIPLGGSTSLSFTVSAPAVNSVDLIGVGFTDVLPSGLAVSTPNGLTGTCGAGTITATAGSSTVALSGAELAPSASCTFSVNVTGMSYGTQNNSATVSSDNGGTGNTTNASVTVTPQTTAVTVTAPSPTVSYGSAVTLTPTYATTDGGTAVTPTTGATCQAATTSTSTSTATYPSPGTYAVTCSGAADSRYTFSYTTGTLTITKATPTVTLTVAPTSTPAVNQPVTLTATVTGPADAPAGPSGTVTFYDNGVALGGPVGLVAGSASLTVTLGAGTHSLTATYNGDSNYTSASTDTASSVTPACTTTITTPHPGLVVATGTTCVVGATIDGGITVVDGANLDLENAKVTGSITAQGSGSLRECGSTTGGITITGATGPVVIGDPANGCAGDTIKGGLTATNNTGGGTISGNTITGSWLITDNTPAFTVTGNHH